MPTIDTNDLNDDGLDDDGLISGLQHLIDYSGDDLTQALSTMSFDDMLALADAVKLQDKAAVLDLMGPALAQSKKTPESALRKNGTKTMLERHMVRTTPLKEGTMGMTSIAPMGDDLQRLQALAGIAAPEAEAEAESEIDAPDEEVTVEEIPDVEDVEAEGDEECPRAQVMAALDTIEQNIDGVLLKDLKAVRKRITAITTMLNESAGVSIYSADGSRKRK